MRDLQKSLGARSNTFRASITPRADSLAALVSHTIAQYEMVLPEFRVGMQSAADAFAEARAAGRVGWQSMQALGVSIAALRVDDERARAEASAEESSSGGGRWTPPADDGGSVEAPVVPPVVPPVEIPPPVAPGIPRSTVASSENLLNSPGVS